MSIDRGTIYRFTGGSAGTVAFLVLTNNQWNDCMESVAVVPLQPVDLASTMPTEPVITVGRPLRIVAGRVLNWSKDDLGTPLYVLENEKLAEVEDILVDVLALQDLSTRPSRDPSSPPGPVDYPRWGEIYWAGERMEGERKRYVVVSNNYWNKDTKTAVMVRTTSQERRGGAFFPAIQQGRARACCGNVTTFARAAVDLSGNRPFSGRLNLQDMIAVAEGLVDALELDQALERRFV